MDKEIKVSPEMVSEGLRVYEDLRTTYDAKSLVAAIYTAMALVDPANLARAKDENSRSDAGPNDS